MDLKGKRALVTGGTKGIGLAVSESLLRAGCRVAICSRTETEISEFVRSLQAAGSRICGQACDVSDHRQVERLMSFCTREMGGLDILVNNAGVGIFKKMEELSIEQWQTTIRTNLDGVFYCCRYALPLMKAAGAGFIINIASLAGKNAFPTGAAYNASKFGLVGFSEALMQEVRHDGIQVAYVMPGSVDTWFSGKPPEGRESWKLSAQDVAEVVLDTLSRHSRCLTSRIEMRPSRPPKK